MRGEIIKQLRLRCKMTQSQFAHFLGVSFATVNRWENEQCFPSALAWEKIMKLQRTIEVELDGEEIAAFCGGEDILTKMCVLRKILQNITHEELNETERFCNPEHRKFFDKLHKWIDEYKEVADA